MSVAWEDGTLACRCRTATCPPPRDQGSLPFGHLATEERNRFLRLAKVPGMRWLILPSVAVMLCWLGILFSLPATSAPELPPAFVMADAAQVDGGAKAPLPDSASSPITTIAEEIQQTDRYPVNASLLTMLLSLSFGASVLWMATNDRRRRAASCLWSADDRRWLAVGCEGSFFLGVFRL